jgi:ribosomal-protein-alanine N-acetyltransferase
MNKATPMPDARSIRPATTDDLSKILEIETRCYRPPLSPWTEKHFREELERAAISEENSSPAAGMSALWVMTDDETDEEVQGYIVFRSLFEEIEILNIAVSPALHKQGIGAALLRKVVHFALLRQDGHDKCERIVLDVRKSNLPAITLYQNHRFSITHVRKAFYSDGEDAYHMQLDLVDLPNMADHWNA